MHNLPDITRFLEYWLHGFNHHPFPLASGTCGHGALWEEGGVCVSVCVVWSREGAEVRVGLEGVRVYRCRTTLSDVVNVLRLYVEEVLGMVETAPCGLIINLESPACG